MRILRGKSNLEVSSQGFALFVLGLILATFLGGAVRTILSSERVHSRIVSELKSRFPRNEFQIGGTEVLLSRGLWPGLGLRLRNVVFKQDVCGKLSFTLEVPQLTLPVDVLSLRHGRARLGSVEMLDGKMHLNYRECPRQAEKNPVAAAAQAPQGIRSAVAEKGIKPPQLDWHELEKNIDALEIRDFKITYERNITWKLLVHSAEVRFDDGMQMQARLTVQKSLPFGTLEHSVNFEATGEKQDLQWALKSEFKEGLLRWKGTWDLSRNSAAMDVQMTQIPLKDLSSEIYLMGFADREVKLKTAWLTCKAGWEGSVDDFAASPVQLRACSIEGAYGRVDLEEADVFTRHNPPLKVPANFHVQKLQLQPLIESLGRQVLPAVLARLGAWTGVLSFTQPTKWAVEGMLENMEIVFSNQSVRGKQLVRSLKMRAARNGDAIQGQINNVRLQDGDFAGELKFDLSDDGRSGTFAVDIERLAFSPAIQNILIGGTMSPLKLAGKGALAAGELSQWQGVFTASELRGDGWRSEGIEVKSRYAPGVFNVDAHAARLTADARWRYYPQLRVVQEQAGDSFDWKDLNAKLEILRNGGTLNQLSAAESLTPRNWRAKGTWVREGVFSGTLMVGNQKVYALHGEKNALAVQDKQLVESP